MPATSPLSVNPTAVTLLPPYPSEAFATDMAKVTGGRNDPSLTEVLIAESEKARTVEYDTFERVNAASEKAMLGG